MISDEGEMKPYERGMRELKERQNVLIVIPPLSNHFYHLYLFAITSCLSRNGTNVTLIFNRGPKISKDGYIEVTRKTAKLEKKFLNFLLRNGVRICEIIESDKVDFVFQEVKSGLENCITAGDLLDINHDLPLLKLSLHSSFVSYIASADELVELEYFKGILENLVKSFHFSRQFCESFHASRNFDAVIFLNGRDPGQAGVRHFAEQMGLPWFSLEHGSTPGINFHLESFQTQDRLAIQERMQDCVRMLSDQELAKIEAWYESWSRNQRQGKVQNPNNRSGQLPYDLLSHRGRLIPIFTTSLEEDISSVGYSRIDLKTLISKTIETCQSLKAENYIPVVVIHPNSLNKSWRDLKILFSSFISEEIIVIWPWSNTSSYNLLIDAPFCITWRSTIGLEAILQGVPCLNLTESTYDLFVGVPDFSFSNLAEFKISLHRRNALCYLYMWMNHGHTVKNFCSDSEYNQLKNYLHTSIDASKTLGRIRYYYSIVSVAWKAQKATPKQFHRYFQLIGGEGLIHKQFTKNLSGATNSN